MDENDVL
jgi:hypothetical protein